MLSVLILLFTVIPALEIYVLFSIGDVIGGLNTLLLVLVTGIVGAALAKSQGLAILLNVQSDLERGVVPTHQFIHGLLVFGGGLLLLTPGFMTDILGLSMVFPGTRHALAQAIKHYFAKGIERGTLNVNFYSNTTSWNERGPFHKEKGPHRGQESGQGRQVGPNTFEADYEKK